MKKALDYLATFKPEDIDGSEEKPITLKRNGEDYTISGQDFLLGRAQQNFWFHVTTAYNICAPTACRSASPTYTQVALRNSALPARDRRGCDSPRTSQKPG